jgi:hypothetical protein
LFAAIRLHSYDVGQKKFKTRRDNNVAKLETSSGEVRETTTKKKKKSK